MRDVLENKTVGEHMVYLSGKYACKTLTRCFCWIYYTVRNTYMPHTHIEFDLQYTLSPLSIASLFSHTWGYKPHSVSL